MSSGKEEQEALRLNAAMSIKPGWTPMTFRDWVPKADAPQLSHLKEAAKRRGMKPLKHWNDKTKWVTWLAANGTVENMPQVFDQAGTDLALTTKVDADAAAPSNGIGAHVAWPRRPWLAEKRGKVQGPPRPRGPPDPPRG